MPKVLIITNKDDIATDFVVKRLSEKNVMFYRLNTEDICHSLSLTISPQKNRCVVMDTILGREVDLMEFDSIYFRRPKLTVYFENDLSLGEREFLSSEMYFTLEALYKMLSDKYWISPVYSIREAENKPYQLLLAQKLGFVTPETILTSNPIHLREFMMENTDCIIKPVHNGRVFDPDNPRIVYTSAISKDFDDNMICYSPNYVQKEIKKKYDVRVTIVGNVFFSVSIDSQCNKNTIIDWRKGQNILKHKVIQLPLDIEERCIALLKSLHLRYAAIDFIIDNEGNYIFLEINPNGQWAWVEHLTGLQISTEIANLLIQNHEKKS